MRIATSQIYNIATQGISQAQTAVNKLQEQMSTGKRVLSPADDPIAATSILRLNQEIARTEQYAKNINIAENNLNLEETSLKSVLDLVQRVRELAISAGNTAVLTEQDYKALAAEVDTRLDELLNLQNTRDSAGHHIFSGYKVFAGYQGDKNPFVDNGGGNYSYLGDEGQLLLQASATTYVAVNDSGKNTFVDIPSSHNTFTTSASSVNKAVPPATISVGQVIDQAEFDEIYPDDLVVSFSQAGLNTVYSVTTKTSGKLLVSNQAYTSGQNIEVGGVSFQITGNPDPGSVTQPGDKFFIESTDKQGLLTTLSRFSDAMKNVKNTSESKAELAELVAKTLTNLGNSLDHVSEIQGEVGARLNTLDTSKDVNLDVTLFGKTSLSNFEDLDYADASIQLSIQSFVLSASQQSFVRLSQLSLFTYL